MKGILGKKLGMSQVFDPDTGAMTAVTVIEAGPCPVVQVKTSDVDGYDAVQLAFDAVAERKLSKAEVGHLKKAGAAPHRHLVELRGVVEAAVGETVTVESFEPGEAIKVSGVSIGKGYAGVMKRHGFAGGMASHGILGMFVGDWLAGLLGVKQTAGIDWIRHALQLVVAMIAVGAAATIRGRRATP